MTSALASVRDCGLVPEEQRQQPHRGRLHVLLAACARVERWFERMRERRMLAELTDRDLRDIGLSRYDAMHEWRKPFWQP